MRNPGWGKWLAELIPYHRNRCGELAVMVDTVNDYHIEETKRTQLLEKQVEQLEADAVESKSVIADLRSGLQSAAESRIRAEDQSRFLQSQLSTLQSQHDAILQRLLLTNEKTTDFLALAVSGGRRALFADTPQPTTAESDAQHQPITTGKVRAGDLRAAATQASESKDRRHWEEVLQMARQMRQRAAAESHDEGEDEPTVQPVNPIQSAARQKAAADIANAIEEEILGTAV